MIEIAAEMAIKERVELALRYAQENNVDLFEFADIFHRKYPHQLNRVHEDWGEFFQTIETQIELNVAVRRIGMTRLPSRLSE